MLDLVRIMRYDLGMARIKKGKSVRISDAALLAIQDLREKMSRATHIGGLQLAPFGRLSDGTVIGFGVALAGYVMNEQFSVIDRRDFAEKLDKQLEPLLAGLGECTDEERKARLSLCIAAASEVGGYSADEPLRAAKTEGGQPS